MSPFPLTAEQMLGFWIEAEHQSVQVAILIAQAEVMVPVGASA